MEEQTTLVKTLVFQLDIGSNNRDELSRATYEARSVYNESIRLAKEGIDQATIASRVADEATLVKNTTQRIVRKALNALENSDESLPSHTKKSPYPLRANYGEGYTLSLSENGAIRFRISTEPYTHVTGTLQGSDAHTDLLKAAIEGSDWKIGTAEALFNNGTPELHISITNEEQSVRKTEYCETVIGVDVNEDNVGLTALTPDGVADTLVFEFPEVKYERHRHLTMRKRIQKAEKKSAFSALRGREKSFVRDTLHKVSRYIVDWCTQFENPCIVFEDLTEMRENIDYGTRMNRRLHHLPFRTLQFYTSYKSAFEGIPTDWVNPEYTSQRCPLCGYTDRANRRKRRFKCERCSQQDHADRAASVNVAMKGAKRHTRWNVPALNSLPQVRKVRREASGAVDAPAVTSRAD